MKVLLLFTVVYILNAAADDFNVQILGDGSYWIFVKNSQWLQSAPTFFRADGRVFSTTDGSLKLVKTLQNSGQDIIGQWTSHSLIYQAGSSQVETSFVKYSPDPSIFTYNNPPLPFWVFKQRYLTAANGTSCGDQDKLISGFPGLLIRDAPVPLGYMAFGGNQAGYDKQSVGQWGPSSLQISDGLLGGLIALFDKEKSANTLLISPASEFMSSSIWRQSGADGNNLYWGTMGSVNDVPAMFESSYILFCGNQGINKAWVSWGEIMKTWYGKTDSFRKSDFIVNYIGYWMDNGAFYYHHTDEGHTFQDAVVGTADEFQSKNIPLRYIQIDDWWFYQDERGHIIKWDAPPNIFPNGLSWLFNKTNVPFLGYSKSWSNVTTYAKVNGGEYDFIIDGERSLPMEERFWTDLLATGRQWGLLGFEHDWLDVQYKSIKPLTENVDLGRQWLMQMGNAVAKSGMTIQYCMAFPREVLQSLELPVVTNTRVSEDYHPGSDHWKIGLTSLFVHSVGLAPFKDNFWSTMVQPGTSYDKGKATEPYSALNAVVSTLSTGPVGPSDKVGYLNKTLIMKCANEEGLILKPSRPVTAIDDQIRKMAWSDFNGPDGEVYSTWSDFGGQNKYGIILAAGLNDTYSLTPDIAGFQGFSSLMVYEARTPDKIQPFNDNSPLTMSGCSLTEFCLFHASPIMEINKQQIVIQGELSKWVPMSPQRVKTIIVSDDIVISLTGAPSENVPFYFNVNGASSPISCQLGKSGSATLSFNRKQCIPE